MGTEINAGTPQELLQERLSDPQTVESLNRLLDRLDVIAFSFDALEGFLGRAEVIIESLSSGLAELRPALEAGGEGGELLESLPRLARTGTRLAEVAERPEVERLLESGLLEKLAAPQTLASLGTMLDKIELVTFLLEAVDGFLKRGDTMADSLAEGAEDLRQTLPKVDGEQMRRAAERFPDLVDAGEVLAEAGMFERSTVEVLGELGRTIADSHHEIDRQPAKTIGLLGLLKALRDPQIQNTLRLGLEVARHYGERLEERQKG